MFKNKLLYILLVFVMLLSACGKQAAKDGTVGGSTGDMVSITDRHGKIDVKKNPERLVVLDNRSFETLEAWGVKIDAVPKGVMDQNSSYVKDANVQDIGNHKEPNLELIASINPELVIIGQRFASYYEDIKKLVPNATVIDLDIDLSENADKPGENLKNGFESLTKTLGLIFGKEAEADKLIAEFNDSLMGAKKAYKGEKVMSVIVSGGKIRFAAPKTGRVWGPLYELMDWKSSLELEKSSADHKGDDISVEAIAQSNPEWLFVLDRDAAVASVENAIPAKDTIIGSEALKNNAAIKNDKLVFAPDNTYTNESIQNFIKIFNDLKVAFESK